MNDNFARAIVAIVGFVIFGLGAVVMGCYSWLEAYKCGLIGSCLLLLILNIPDSEQNQNNNTKNE